MHNFVNEFHIGVTIFFVLSGFLITYRYYNKIIAGDFNLLQYIKNRVARIYPMYFILTSITFLFVLWRGDFKEYGIFQQLFLYLSNITFLKGFFNDLKFTLIAQGWSLTVEECFYFSAPIILMLVSKRKFYFFLLPILILLWGFIMVLTIGKLNIFGLFEDFKFMLIYTFFGRCIEFFVGIALALIILKNKDFFLVKKTYLALLGIIICIVWLGLIKGDEKSGLRQPLGIFINNFILPINISLFFWGLITEKTLINKFLSTKVMVILGKSSFIFYLIHMGVFHIFISTYISKNSLIAFLLLNLISICLYFLIEEPLNKVIRNLKLNYKIFRIQKLT